MIGLYVHIPFCVRKCHYCDFVTTGSGSRRKHRLFLDAFEKEALRYEEDFRKVRFETFYVGGGTPSDLAEGEFRDLFAALKRSFNFEDGIEVTCEVNPGDLTPEKAVCLRQLGVNRVSLGVQSFNEETLKRLNRAHGVRQIFDSFKILRQTGFGNISLDLILSLPQQTFEDVRYSLEQAVGLGPQHVSLYELTVEKNTVFGSRFEKGLLPLPDEETQHRMLRFARGFLKQNGFDHYELLSYAKEGFRSRHNLLYWANGEYLGLGPGAFSYLEGRRFRHSGSFEEYLSKVGNGDWTASEEETLDPLRKDIESFLLSLRLSEGAEIRRHPAALRHLRDGIAGLTQKGFLCRDGANVRLTDRGQFFAETVFSELSLPDAVLC